MKTYKDRIVDSHNIVEEIIDTVYCDIELASEILFSIKTGDVSDEVNAKLGEIEHILDKLKREMQ